MLLATGASLPPQTTGLVVLVASLAVTALWLFYLYR